MNREDVPPIKKIGAQTGASTKNLNWGLKLDQVPEAEEFKESKLFWVGDRVTLTFFAGEEVASIHFDRQRSEIFYRGHNLKNIHPTPEQWHFLEIFPIQMAREGVDAEIRAAYEECLTRNLAEHKDDK